MDMEKTFLSWGQHIVNNPLEKVVDFIVTNKTVDTAQVNEPLRQTISEQQFDGMKILDFGCGAGRNCTPMAMEFSNLTFVGYDNPGMINHTTEYCKQKYDVDISTIKNLSFSSSWEQIKQEKFDLVFATLVFQHIPVDAIKQYIEDISSMTHSLFVHGRTYNDHSDQSVWQIFESVGLKPKEGKHPHRPTRTSHYQFLYDFGE